VIPIRGLYVDALRLVVDVAAPSEVIDDVYAAIEGALSEFQAPDGAPLLGTPVGFADQSELSFAADLPATALHSSWLAELYEAQLPGRPLRVGLQVRPLDADTSAAPIPGTTYTLDLRTGSRPDQHLWFSSAPLDSAGHVAYVEQLVGRLSANRSTPEARTPWTTPPPEA